MRDRVLDILQAMDQMRSICCMPWLGCVGCVGSTLQAHPAHYHCYQQGFETACCAVPRCVMLCCAAPCCAVTQVTELWQFFVVRMLTGISVGGCFPLVFSLLGDLFPVSQRAAMSAIVQIAVGGGIGGGQVSCTSSLCLLSFLVIGCSVPPTAVSASTFSSEPCSS